MGREVTLPPGTPSIQRPSFGSRSSFCTEDLSTILPLRDQNPRQVGQDAAPLSRTLLMEQRRPNKYLPAPLSLPAPHDHTWLQNQLHFLIKSESHTEGMTWLLQLIFFSPFQIIRFHFLRRKVASCRREVGFKTEGCI